MGDPLEVCPVEAQEPDLLQYVRGRLEPQYLLQRADALAEFLLQDYVCEVGARLAAQRQTPDTLDGERQLGLQA